MTRRETREAVFLLLFQNELSKSDIDEISDDCAEAYDMELNAEVKRLAKQASEHYEEFDAIIGKYSETREVSRISGVNKTILRLALFEILYCPNVPNKVAANEAVELSKKYAEKRDSGFINAVLGHYLKDSGNDGA
ncbi:MAG: transcription antitermination factor NusB [Ruminiclostridium sp.]|nr:transcription antitermination factor NusB [Ruminiclostridium sp.]